MLLHDSGNVNPQNNYTLFEEMLEELEAQFLPPSFDFILKNTNFLGLSPLIFHGE